MTPAPRPRTVTARTLRREKKTVGEGLTGRSTKAAALSQMVSELGGAKAVADLVGRSVRSVQRWVAGKQKPKADAATALQAAHQTHTDRPDYRRSQLPPSRATRMRRHGARIRATLIGGPTNDSPGASIKARHVTWDLSPAAMDALIEAWVTGGDDAARETLDEVLYAEYIEQGEYDRGGKNIGWQTESLSSITFDHLR